MLAQFEIRDKVSEFVYKSAMAPVKGFYPTAVAKFAKTSVSNVFPYLIDYTKSGELALLWELRCPDFNCHQTIDFNHLNINDEVECPKCGMNFIISERDFFLRFDFNQSYKDYIRKKSKKKQVFTLRN
ncbi:hypothetical protein NST17_06980 [Caldifermentibacillus hisashii]|uniref:Transcriptional regulator n=1 Tax=Caldifermentibacillus hisashii TaxID=996558 RepID=A0ABU9JYP7_9BACI|nr:MULTISPECIES: hypothetical protein [Bacillaceae]MBU5342265.1 hypothetical protein [Caldifermentibacillus hisashii]